MVGVVIPCWRRSQFSHRAHFFHEDFVIEIFLWPFFFFHRFKIICQLVVKINVHQVLVYCPCIAFVETNLQIRGKLTYMYFGENFSGVFSMVVAMNIFACK